MAKINVVMQWCVRGFLGAILLGALASCVSAPPAYPPGRSDIIAQALSEWDEGRLEQVSGDLEKILRDSDRPEPYLSFWLAKRYMAKDDLAGAAYWLDQALTADPLFALAWFDRGLLELWYKQDGNQETALRDLRKAAELAPGNADIVLLLAEQLKWKEGAQAEIDTIMLRHVTSNPVSVRGRAWWAVWLVEQDRFDAAQVKAKEAQALVGKSTSQDDANAAVIALYRTGLDGEGNQAFSSLISRDSKDSWAWWSLGEGLFYAGKYDKSSAAFDQGRRLEGQIQAHIGFHAGLARLFAADGLLVAEPRDLAVADLKSYVAQPGDRPEYAAARLALGLLATPGFSVDPKELEQSAFAHWRMNIRETRAYLDWFDRLLKLAGE